MHALSLRMAVREKCHETSFAGYFMDVATD